MGKQVNVEDLIVNAIEHKLLKLYKKKLEKRNKVKIDLPKIKPLDSDVIFVSIRGENKNIDSVKTFLSKKMNAPSKRKKNIVITLSDSEEEMTTSEKDDSTSVFASSSNSKRSQLANSPSFIESSAYAGNYQFGRLPSIHSIDPFKENAGNTSKITNAFSQTQNQESKRKELKNLMKVRSKSVSSSSDDDVLDICEVTSTTDDAAPSEIDHQDSIIILNEYQSADAAAELIPMCKQNKSSNSGTNNKACKRIIDCDESIVIVDEVDIDASADFIPLHKQIKSVKKFKKMKNSNPMPSCINIVEELSPRRLRPIVIDGSNVAMAHGKANNVYSTEGIQLAIQYFQNRGHTEITAFVPLYRRNCNPNRKFPTSNPSILDQMEKRQLVVFTPSRRFLDGKCISSYDDAFIVQFAAEKGGVIVSNDNFRDLVPKNDSFKEVIEKRLLMFCFVGDTFMVPEDPLGREGPKLKDFLCF